MNAWENSYTLPVNQVEAFHVVQKNEEMPIPNSNYGLKAGDIILAGKKIKYDGPENVSLTNIYYSTDADRSFLKWRKYSISTKVDLSNGYFFEASLRNDSPYSPYNPSHYCAYRMNQNDLSKAIKI